MTPTARPDVRLLVLGVCVSVVLAWSGWLAWDTRTTRTDEVESGPYEAWQVVGVVLSLVVILVVALRRAPRHASAIQLALVFTIAACTTLSYRLTGGPDGPDTEFALAGGLLVGLATACGAAATTAVVGRTRLLRR